MQKDKIHIYFDDDGVLHKWQNISVEIPEAYMDMSDADKAQYVKQEVYAVLTGENYYYNLPVQSSMAELATALHEEGYDIRILSCSINDDTSRQKMASLKECLPWITPDLITLLPDGLGSRKALYVPETCKQDINLLIDDHTPNCTAFRNYWGSGTFDAIKCINDVNGLHGTWRGLKVDIGHPLAQNRMLVEDAIHVLEKVHKEQSPYPVKTAEKLLQDMDDRNPDENFDLEKER